MPKSKKEIIEKLKKVGMSLRKSPWLERAKERQKEMTKFYCEIETNPAHGKCDVQCNHCKKAFESPDYKGFCEHYQEYVEFGIPIGIRDLVDLAERYNCPIPKFKDGKPIFEDESK